MVVVGFVVVVERVVVEVVVVVVTELGFFSTQNGNTSFISTNEILKKVQALCGNSPTLIHPTVALSNWYIPCSG